ncbi:MAG: hypothetical protein IIT39_17275 [Clostridia bacterium]|nr:hypothetical protein [Clostridia bacterium]
MLKQCQLATYPIIVISEDNQKSIDGRTQNNNRHHSRKGYTKSNGEIEMKKSEQKEFAKDILMEAIACAYYKLYDQCDEVPEEEKDEINEYIRKYGKAMARSIGKEFFT